MSYYKILKNNAVVDVNNTYFRYQRKRMNIIHCSAEDAELIQSSDRKNFYTTGWLKPLPQEVHAEWVEAVLINKEEYDKLKEQLEIKDFIIEEPEVIDEPTQQSTGVVDEVKSEKIVSIRDLYEEIRQLKEELRSLKK